MATEENSLEYFQKQFDSFKAILDDDQRRDDNLIRLIRKKISLNENEELTTELAKQLSLYEEQSVKIHEQNKRCLVEKFQNLFQQHREGAKENVRYILQQIEREFRYRPNVKKYLEELLSRSNEKFSIKKQTFCNRRDIEAFQQHQQETISSSGHRPSIESNEIDLTKLIRETSSSHQGSDRFRFSNVSNSHQQLTKQTSPTANISTAFYANRLSCSNALLLSANKHYGLLYNIDMPEYLYIYDLQTRTIKEHQWDESAILSLGYVDNHQFYMITSKKIFLFDVIKESIVKQYLLYDSLYKDLLLIENNSSYQTQLKRTNQLQSTVDDDYCYYLYLTREYHQVLIKFSVVDFHPDFRWNLQKYFPFVECFLGFTVDHSSLITFLVRQDNQYKLIFCDECRPERIVRENTLHHVKQAEQIQSVSMINLPSVSKTKRWNYSSKKFYQYLWLIFDRTSQCVHVVNYDNTDKQIVLSRTDALESISIIDKQQLLVVFNPFDIQLIDLDQYLSS